MRALTVVPGRSESLRVVDAAAPTPGPGELLVHGLALGVCGTDKEITRGEYGWAPHGQESLVLGHESLGRVTQSPPDSWFSPGDLVVGVVRRPDPVPCEACAAGEFDMCRNSRYTERGIKEIHGYGSEMWTVEEDYAVLVDDQLADVGVLVEPASIVAKAWEQVWRVAGTHAWLEPKRVLVTGAGPIGLLAALIGSQHGLDVHVLDRVVSGPKPGLVKQLGATYHHDPVDEVVAGLMPDIVIEATGAGSLVFEVMSGTAARGIVCLTGVSPAGRAVTIDAGAINRELVLENDVVFGSVNANNRHYRLAADALLKADRDWLETLITRRVPLSRAAEAFHSKEDDVKVVITLTE